jgi:hypothetical protein
MIRLLRAAQQRKIVSSATSNKEINNLKLKLPINLSSVAGTRAECDVQG